MPLGLSMQQIISMEKGEIMTKSECMQHNTLKDCWKHNTTAFPKVPEVRALLIVYNSIHLDMM